LAFIFISGDHGSLFYVHEEQIKQHEDRTQKDEC